MTDQQRFDAIGLVQEELARYDGKLKVRTPNLDRLFRQGAYFKNAYCHSPVCGPARGALRTGCTLERTGLQANKSEEKEVYEKIKLFENKVTNSVSLDQTLADEMGYQVEYYGKWHLPDFYHFNKSRFNQVTNAVTYNDYDFETKRFKLSTNEAWVLKLRRYLKYDESQGNIKREFRPGDQLDTYSRFPYTPIRLDARYGLPTDTDIDNTGRFPQLDGRKTQPNIKGPYSLGKDYTAIAYNGKIAVKALDRLARSSKPFALTVSFHNPHAPMLPTKEHLKYYWDNRDKIFITPNLNDDMSNSAYSNDKYRDIGYKDANKLKEWIALYYAMIEEIDDYVGQMFDTLEKHGKSRNTLIVFTSDHGEMLGSHAMREKNVFYEESVRIPLAISFPGIIPKTIVDTPVGHLDIYATILDYLGGGVYDDSDGTSLRRFIDKTSVNDKHDERFVVAEWDFRKPVSANSLDRSLGSETNFMVLKGNYKLMMTKLSGASRLDMMYDFHSDPYEVNNLVGRNGATASDEVIGKAEHLKCLLVEWMERMDGTAGYYSKSFVTDSTLGPYTDGIKSSEGDIKEISNRRQWRGMNFWISDKEVAFDLPVWKNNQFVQSEYIYFGRTTAGMTTIENIEIKGTNADLFTIDTAPSLLLTGRCASLKVTYTAPFSVNEVDAFVEITHTSGNDIVRLNMGKSTSTFSPTFSQVPTVFPTTTSAPSPTATISHAPTPFLGWNWKSLLKIVFSLFQLWFQQVRSFHF